MAVAAPKGRLLVDTTHVGRYFGHSDSGSLCVMLDENSNRICLRSRTLMLECLDAAASIVYAEPPADLNDDSLIDQFVLRRDPFTDRMHEQESVQLKLHAACYDKFFVRVQHHS